MLIVNRSANAQSAHAERSAAHAAVAVITGIAVSGPLSLAVVGAVHPQPAWTSAARFAAEYRPIQLLPYIGGFVLVAASLWLVSALHAVVPRERKSRANLALTLAASFGALICLNYILQTTFVPSLIHPYEPANAALVSALTMANPRSLAWTLEMWGYAVLGAATWAIACVFGASRLERWAARAFVANGIVSIAGAIATVCSPSWALTTTGIVSFAAWNALVVAMGILTFRAMRARHPC